MLIVHASSSCDICLDAYDWDTPTQMPHAIPCGHIFCKTCPFCRNQFVANRIVKLHVDRPATLEQGVEDIELLQRLGAEEAKRQVELEAALVQSKQRERALRGSLERARRLRKQREEEAEARKQREKEAEARKQREKEAEARKQREEEAEARKQRKEEAEARKQRKEEAEARKQRKKEAKAPKQREKEAEARKQQPPAVYVGLTTIQALQFVVFAHSNALTLNLDHGTQFRAAQRCSRNELPRALEPGLLCTRTTNISIRLKPHVEHADNDKLFTSYWHQCSLCPTLYPVAISSVKRWSYSNPRATVPGLRAFLCNNSCLTSMGSSCPFCRKPFVANRIVKLHIDRPTSEQAIVDVELLRRLDAEEEKRQAELESAMEQSKQRKRALRESLERAQLLQKKREEEVEALKQQPPTVAGKTASGVVPSPRETRVDEVDQLRGESSTQRRGGYSRFPRWAPRSSAAPSSTQFGRGEVGGGGGAEAAWRNGWQVSSSSNSDASSEDESF
ncbi:uncharacterized protein LACBIDRAFT_325830 [Laccaria bicolor S238N-H82]|uniref:Predicted protein n=1 Tax=Laccaria bicolor (strain S238N-H82 / ATCC MYA-4686) TaxID=486041 RepID=B0D6D6_LACBS|nr:uncharacterized protein LACBIDRAFT_325830 [Laccaria bicolor S238N-H82]EDR09933.1 predicted protein [Laccaria bicolor S238N-H82]|eukprot:XP_001879318.1 predicted protein [Laccaria bicolor S238N-H82]